MLLSGPIAARFGGSGDNALKDAAAPETAAKLVIRSEIMLDGSASGDGREG